MLVKHLFENDLMPPKLLAMSVAKVLYQVATVKNADCDFVFSKLYTVLYTDGGLLYTDGGGFKASLYFKTPSHNNGRFHLLTGAMFDAMLHDNYIPNTMVCDERTVGGDTMRVVEIRNLPELQVDRELLKTAINHEFRRELPGTVQFVG